MYLNSLRGINVINLLQYFYNSLIYKKIKKLLLSPHLKSLSPHVANGDKVGQPWSRHSFNFLGYDLQFFAIYVIFTFKTTLNCDFFVDLMAEVQLDDLTNFLSNL
jgi:hypothetical protein